jgi:hypothetical protein
MHIKNTVVKNLRTANGKFSSWEACKNIALKGLKKVFWHNWHKMMLLKSTNKYYN